MGRVTLLGLGVVVGSLAMTTLACGGSVTGVGEDAPPDAGASSDRGKPEPGDEPPPSVPPPTKKPSCGPVTGQPRIIGSETHATNIVPTKDVVFWCHVEVVDGRFESRIVGWNRKTSQTTLVAEANCSTLAADKSWLYWTDAVAQRLGRTAKSGGVPAVLFTGAAAPSWSYTEGWYDIALDATRVYWADFRDFGGIYAGAKDGGQAERIAEEAYAMGVAVDDAAVYWVGEKGVKSWSKTSHEISVLTPEHPHGNMAVNLAIDETYVYWIGRRGLERTPKAGGETEHLYENKQLDAPVSTLSVEAGCVYFNVGSELFRMPVTGGTPFLVGTKNPGAGFYWIAVDDHGIYWSDFNQFDRSGHVFMLAH